MANAVTLGRAAIVAVLAAWAVFLALKLTPSFYGLNLLKQAAWGIVCTLGLLWVLGWERRRPAIRHAPTIAALDGLLERIVHNIGRHGH